jgi:quercetin dioxygenase-like cupin family protein
MSSASPAPSVLVSAEGAGEALWFLGTLAVVRVPGEAVEERFALMEFLFPHGASPPLHTHPQDESYVVLEGRMIVQAGEQVAELQPGAVMVVPRGAAHSFAVLSDTARVLVMSTPAGIERFVRDGSVPATAAVLPPPDAPRPSPAELDAIFASHDCNTVGPRLAGEPEQIINTQRAAARERLRVSD